MTSRIVTSSTNDDNRWLWTRGVVPALLVMALAAATLLLPLGDHLGDRLPAVFTLIGGLVTYTATIIRISVQRQAQRRLAEEHDRTEKRLDQEGQEQSRRLELEAAMRAGQLITPTDTASADSGSPAAVASGLLALTNLNQAELAVSLLVDLWSDGVADDDGKPRKIHSSRVANEIAILVINRALCSDSPSAQLIAAELLCRNATKLTATQSLHWPAVLDGGWRPEFGARTKLLLVEALVNMTTCPKKPADEAALRAIAVRLYCISSLDPEKRVKACIGKLINALLPSLDQCTNREFAQGNVMVTIESLHRAAAPRKDNPDGYLSALSDGAAARLQDWSKGATGIPSNPGCLATAAVGDGAAAPTG
jgi:hypothetical protein